MRGKTDWQKDAKKRREKMNHRIDVPDAEICKGYYSKVIDSSPLLTKKEELALANLILNGSGAKQQDARERLFIANIRLVLKIAHFYAQHSSSNIRDLTQAGMIGLGVAIDKFNPNKFQTRFSTYATPWIKLKIFDALSNDVPVSIPSNIADKSRQYKKILDQDESTDLNNEQLMDALQVSKNGLRNIKAVNSSTMSLESPIHKESGMTTLQEILPDSKNVLVSKKMEKEETKKIIRIALGTLNPIQQEILTLRYLDDNEKNGLMKLGKKYQLTGERIRQIEYKALKTLRFRLKSKENFTI